MFESFTLKPLICSNDASENLNSSVAFLWCQHWWRVWCLASLFLPPAIISKLQKVSDIKVLQEFQKIIKCPHVSATLTLRAILKKQHDTYHRPVETASLAHQMLCCQAFVTSAAGDPDSLTLYVVKSMESHRSVPEKSAKPLFLVPKPWTDWILPEFSSLLPSGQWLQDEVPSVPSRQKRAAMFKDHCLLADKFRWFRFCSFLKPFQGLCYRFVIFISPRSPFSPTIIWFSGKLPQMKGNYWRYIHFSLNRDYGIAQLTTKKLSSDAANPKWHVRMNARLSGVDFGEKLKCWHVSCAVTTTTPLFWSHMFF